VLEVDGAVEVDCAEIALADVNMLDDEPKTVDWITVVVTVSVVGMVS